MILVYPVQRQRLPEIAYRISSYEGFGLRFNNATLDIICPGMQ